MKICFLVAALVIPIGIFFLLSIANHKKHIDICRKDTSRYEKFIDRDDNVTEPVVACLKLTGIYIKGDSHNAAPGYPKPLLIIGSKKLQEVMKAIQGKIDPSVSWVMKGKGWEMYNSLLTPETAKRILEIGLNDLAFKYPVYPQRKDYKGLLLLGATTKRFYERLLFVDQLSQKGITFNKVYILTGRRPLEAFEKERFPLLKNIDDEGEMALTLFKKELNAKLQKNYVYIYSEPPAGSYRATTESTVQEFKKHNPAPGIYLAVSNGYFIPYQELIIQNCLDKMHPNSAIKVEAVGPGDVTNLEALEEKELVNKASMFLDNLSRVLYNLQVRDEN